MQIHSIVLLRVLNPLQVHVRRREYKKIHFVIIVRLLNLWVIRLLKAWEKNFWIALKCGQAAKKLLHDGMVLNVLELKYMQL